MTTPGPCAIVNPTAFPHRVPPFLPRRCGRSNMCLVDFQVTLTRCQKRVESSTTLLCDRAFIVSPAFMPATIKARARAGVVDAVEREWCGMMRQPTSASRPPKVPRASDGTTDTAHVLPPMPFRQPPDDETTIYPRYSQLSTNPGLSTAAPTASPTISHFPGCTGSIPYINDEHCDTVNNNAEYVHGGGDCCECKCGTHAERGWDVVLMGPTVYPNASTDCHPTPNPSPRHASSPHDGYYDYTHSNPRRRFVWCGFYDFYFCYFYDFWLFFLSLLDSFKRRLERRK